MICVEINLYGLQNIYCINLHFIFAQFSIIDKLDVFLLGYHQQSSHLYWSGVSFTLFSGYNNHPHGVKIQKKIIRGVMKQMPVSQENFTRNF